MLRGMRKMLDKYQKTLLVALTVFLVAVFAMPMGRMMRARSMGVIARYGGKNVTQAEFDSFRDRWLRLGLFFELPFIQPDKPLTGDDVRHAYVLLLAARERGLTPSAEAVRKKVFSFPPQMQRIEYILADPAVLADTIQPADPEIRAHYDAHWPDKTRPFDTVKDDVRRALVQQLARQAAAARIQAAADFLKRLAAGPQEGDAWRQALGAAAAADTVAAAAVSATLEQGGAWALPFRAAAAANEPGLIYNQTDFFSRDNASAVLAPLADPARRLPEGFVHKLFIAAVGKPSTIIRSGDKSFIFRVLDTAAGFSPDGTLVADDWGWHDGHGQFLVLTHYDNYKQLVEDKLRFDVADIQRSFEEYLSLQDYLALAGVARPGDDLLTPDARAQFLAYFGERARSLITQVPAQPFASPQPPSPDQILEFYNARKGRPANTYNYGYKQPLRIQIEYILAPLDKNKQLEDIRRAAESEQGAPLPLEPLAAKAGLTYRLSAFFSAEAARSVLPDLAASPDFIQEAFSSKLFPRSAAGPAGEPLTVRPLTHVLQAATQLFIFRHAQAPRAAEEVEFDKLSPAEQAAVAEDCRRYAALQRATDAARRLRTDAARGFLKTLAAENKLPVRSAIVAGTPGPGAPSSAPPVLADYIAKRLRTQEISGPGELVPLVQDAGACYTAVTTQVDPATQDTHIQYFRLTADAFIAPFIPSSQEVSARARDIHAKARPGQPEPDETAFSEPTPDELLQARAALTDEWKKMDFPHRYLACLRKRAAEFYPAYFQRNPLEFEKTALLEQLDSGFFRIDDTAPFRGDKALVQAAFKLTPGKVTQAVGDSSAAVFLLSPQDKETRQEIRIEYLSVRPGDYDPLSVTVTEAEAETYYKAHPDEFIVPALTKADFLFARYDDFAESISPLITEKEIRDYYELNRLTAYRDRPFDAVLADIIRLDLAGKQAEGAAEQAIVAARAKVQADAPLAAAADLPAPAVKLVAGTTPPVVATDNQIPQIGYAPGLVKTIVAAKQGELSEPVKTDAGWVIFRVTEKTSPRTPELKAVLPAVRDAARRQRLTDKARAALTKLADHLAKNPETTCQSALLRPELAVDLPSGLRAISTGYFDEPSALVQPDLSAALRKDLFKLKPGQNTGPVETKEDLQLARVIDAKTNDLLKVNYILVRADSFAAPDRVTPEEARKYYDAHTAAYERPQQFILESLQPDDDLLSSDVKPTEEQIQNAYEQLTQDFLDRTLSLLGAPVYSPLADVRARVTQDIERHLVRERAADLADKTAEQIAKETARPFPDLAAQNALLRYNPSVEYAPGGKHNPRELENVPGLDAFLASAKPGDTSPVLRAAAGPMLVRVKEIRPAGVASFEEVQEQAQTDAALAQGLAKAKELVERVAAKITAPTAQAMQTAAAQFPVPVKDSLLLAPKELPLVARWQLYWQRVSPEDFELMQRAFTLQAGETADLTFGERASGAMLITLLDIQEQDAPEWAAGSLLRSTQMERLQGLIRQAYEKFRQVTPEQAAQQTAEQPAEE